MGKLKVGWFSFSCSEDSTIMFAEMLNEHFEEWSKLIEFRHARVLKSKNELSDIDVAFVEGAIASEKHAEELKKIRANSKKIVAIGSCACTGMPSAQRNLFDENLKQDIRPLVEGLHLNEKVVPIKDIVQVDDSVPGCPMNEEIFLQVLQKYLKEFGVA